MALWDVITEVGQIGLWLQTIGIIIIIWIIFQLFVFYSTRKRMKEVHEIRIDMKRIEGKLDKLLGKSRK